MDVSPFEKQKETKNDYAKFLPCRKGNDRIEFSLKLNRFQNLKITLKRNEEQCLKNRLDFYVKIDIFIKSFPIDILYLLPF